MNKVGYFETIIFNKFNVVHQSITVHLELDDINREHSTNIDYSEHSENMWVAREDNLLCLIQQTEYILQTEYC